MKPGKAVALACLLVCRVGAAEPAPSPAALLRVQGPISPATAGYVARGVHVAAEEGRSCVVLQLDTPGGLLDSTRDIVQTFYTAPIPVVVYIAPPGAGGTSAGCFITLAAHVAAMAPDTTLGAAHPVTLGGLGSTQPDEDTRKKLENYATTYIESVAARRHRNVAWAASAVRESASLTAARALELNVIDLIATDLDDLLRQLDGREVDGKVLRTATHGVVPIPMQPQERVFQALWRPEVMFLLMLVAVYGIMGELSNPGTLLPGIAGGIAVILLLYLGSVLPLSLAGLALLLLAVGLFVADAFAPTHGVLTVGGMVAFCLGALMLFDKAGPAFRLSLAWIVPATLVTAAFFVLIVGAGLRAQGLPPRTGREVIRGRIATAVTPIGDCSGQVMLDGERWSAVSDTAIAPGQAVEIVEVRGLTLKVRVQSS